MNAPQFGLLQYRFESGTPLQPLLSSEQPETALPGMLRASPRRKPPPRHSSTNARSRGVSPSVANRRLTRAGSGAERLRLTNRGISTNWATLPCGK